MRTHNCALSAAHERELVRHIDQLGPELEHFDPDLVHLEVAIDRHARREEYGSWERKRGMRSEKAFEGASRSLIALLQTIATAHDTLHSKPEHWSLFGWLAWVAHHELVQGVRTTAPA